MEITVGHIVDNPTFMLDGWFEVTETDGDGAVNVLYDSMNDDEIPAELLVRQITYMVVNKFNGRLRLEVG